jgi:hypothetical protein
VACASALPFDSNDGLGHTSRDDASAAAFVMRNVGLLDALDMWSWWTFSDVFEEGWMQSAPFHNGYGTEGRPPDVSRCEHGTTSALPDLAGTA